MALLHSEHVNSNKTEFLAKVESGSKSLGFDPNWLMQVMMNESGLNPAAVNKFSNATGLIQFMPNTAKALGTTVEELRNMSNVAQLDYVFKYFKPYRFKIWSYIDLYFVCFFPIAVGKPSDWIFKASNLNATIIAKQNPSFDLNKDGVLTIKEVEQAMLAKVPAAFRELFKKKT